MCVAEFLDLQGLSYLKLARLGRVESLDSHTALRLPMADDADSEIEVEETEGNPLDPAFFVMKPTWCLTSGTVKWYPEIDTQGGVDFVRLSKFDRHFVKFCLQRPMDLSRGVGRSANSTLFEDLLSLRKTASVASVSAQMEMPETEVDDAAAMTKRRKKRVRDEDVCLVDPVVTIWLTELEFKGETFPSREVKVLFGVKSKALWMELSHDNLTYMRALVQKGEGQAPARKKRSSPKKKLRRGKPLSPSPKKNEGLQIHFLKPSSMRMSPLCPRALSMWRCPALRSTPASIILMLAVVRPVSQRPLSGFLKGHGCLECGEH